MARAAGPRSARESSVTPAQAAAVSRPASPRAAMIISCVLRRRRLLSGPVPRSRPPGHGRGSIPGSRRSHRPRAGSADRSSARANACDPVEARRHCSCPHTGSKMCALMMSLIGAPTQSNCRYASLSPFVTEDSCGSFCQPTWRRSQGDFLLFPSRRPGFWPQFWPQGCSISGPNRVTEGMFRVVILNYKTAEKSLGHGRWAGPAAERCNAPHRRHHGVT
jgi:hypothetical protein